MRLVVRRTLAYHVEDLDDKDFLSADFINREEAQEWIKANRDAIKKGKRTSFR